MNRPISRYLTAKKFEWLLADDGLYLGAAASQSDKDEGKYDHTFVSRFIAQEMQNADKALLRGLNKLQLEMQEFKRSDSYLSCWYLGTEESADMWKDYGTEGVLIVSDSWTLQKTLPEPLKHASQFREVTYDDALKLLAAHDPLFVKNKRFVDEQEYRLIFDLTQYSVLTGFGDGPVVYVGDKPSFMSKSVTAGMSNSAIEESHKVIRRKGSGLVFSYPLVELIKEVRLYPGASEEELLQVQSSLRAKGIDCPVRHSSLNTAVA
jgi:hypothetical protein